MLVYKPWKIFFKNYIVSFYNKYASAFRPFADKIGISPQLLNKYLNGENDPGFFKTLMLLNKAGVKFEFHFKNKTHFEMMNNENFNQIKLK